MIDPMHVRMAKGYLEEKRPETYKRLKSKKATDPETGKETTELELYATRQATMLAEEIEKTTARLDERAKRTGKPRNGMDDFMMREGLMSRYLDPDHM